MHGAEHDPDRDDDARSEQLEEVSDTLERLLDVLSDEEGLHQVLDRLAHTAEWVIAGADAVSVSVATNGGQTLRTEASTSPEVVAIDADQSAAGDGPCLQAVRTREPVRVSLEQARQRWPAFAHAAQHAGVHAYLAAPLILPGERDQEVIGALNVYSYTADAFDPIDAALLRLLTSAVTAAVRNASRYLHSRDLTQQLKKALTSRAEIDQAKGALMAIHGIDADEAFDMLVADSQQQNVKIAALAPRFLNSLRQI